MRCSMTMRKRNGMHIASGTKANRMKEAAGQHDIRQDRVAKAATTSLWPYLPMKTEQWGRSNCGGKIKPSPAQSTGRWRCEKTMVAARRVETIDRRLKNSPAPRANSTTTSVPVREEFLCLSKRPQQHLVVQQRRRKNNPVQWAAGAENWYSAGVAVCFFPISVHKRIRPLMAPEGHRSKRYGNTRRRRFNRPGTHFRSEKRVCSRPHGGLFHSSVLQIVL